MKQTGQQTSGEVGGGQVATGYALLGGRDLWEQNSGPYSLPSKHRGVETWFTVKLPEFLPDILPDELQSPRASACACKVGII